MDAAITDECVGGAIVVFAKCPIAGASKTRLAPLLGDDGAAALARAMLSDVLVSISGYVSLVDVNCNRIPIEFMYTLLIDCLFSFFFH